MSSKLRSNELGVFSGSPRIEGSHFFFESSTVETVNGASAPGPVCLEKFGFTVENVVAKAKALG